MTQQEASSSEKGTPRRFDVELLIIHPTLEPTEITAALGLEAKIDHRVGDQRKTPRGTLLPGSYKDTRWRYSARYDVRDQWFAEKITELADRLKPHKSFLHRVRATGGRATLLIQFLGDGYSGDAIPADTLATLVDLGLDLGIECFSVPQT